MKRTELDGVRDEYFMFYSRAAGGGRDGNRTDEHGPTDSGASTGPPAPAPEPQPDAEGAIGSPPVLPLCGMGTVALLPLALLAVGTMKMTTTRARRKERVWFRTMVRPVVVAMILATVLGGCDGSDNGKEQNDLDGVGKRTERRLRELSQELREAQTEKERENILTQIDGLLETETNVQGKKDGEVKLRLGQVLTFWERRGGTPQGHTRYSISFLQFSSVRGSPPPPYGIGSTSFAAPPGKKYAKVTARVMNLGPRKTNFVLGTRDLEVKVDNGNIYPLRAKRLTRTLDYEPVERRRSLLPGQVDLIWPVERLRSLEPGQAGWLHFWFGEIPEDTTPVEVFGGVGGGAFASEYTRLRLSLAGEHPAAEDPPSEKSDR